MSPDPKAQAALALHRFGVGPRPGSIAAIASDPRGALIAELDRPGAGRIANTDLLASVDARHEARGCGADGAAAEARSGRAAADLSRRGQGAPCSRARCRDRPGRAARLVLVEPLLRLRGQGQCAP